MFLIIRSVIVVIAIVIFSFGCTQGSSRNFAESPNQNSSFSIGASQNDKIYRKGNLETLAVGRNRIEIEQLMGPPEGKSLDGGNGYLWDYRRPVYDEASDKVYAWSMVSFKFLNGLCAYVNIRLENPPIELELAEGNDGIVNSSP